MNSTNESAVSAKCVLLSLLPKPKNGGDKKQALPGKKLPISVTALQPKQTVTHLSRRNDVFDDDEEFDRKLAEKSARQMDGGETNEDDSSGPEEGPSRPTERHLSADEKSVEKPTVRQAVGRVILNRSLGIEYGDSDSSDDGTSGNEADDSSSQDFFGLRTTSPVEKRARMEQEQQCNAAAEPQLFIDEIAPGPSRPSAHPSVDMGRTIGQNDRDTMTIRAISDEEAHRLIYEKELAPFGANPLIAQDAVSQLVDVSVDSALGPNIRENLLKNLSGKQLAQLPLGPPPKMKKSDTDKLAKRKHQITHLASVAVSREEQLQEKWADSKQNKKMSRQKYGF